ncbi:MAG TPA: hypothetical protein DDY98_00905 [Ruminococcaceae bacterium]|nr:hypothetical protein [Oscillospiraceae bacterium]
MNKNEAKMLQGISVIFMVCVHLFCRLNWAELYATPIMLFGLPVSFYIGQIGDFCIITYIICSSYSQMNTHGKEHYYRRRLVSLLVLYGRFWLILILFTIVAPIAGRSDMFQNDVFGYFLSYTGYWNCYNGAWWYLPIYAVFVIFSPLTVRFCQKRHWLLISVIIAVLYVVGYYFRFNRIYEFNFYFNTSRIGVFSMTFAEYLFGLLLCKLQFFEKAKAIAEKIKPVWYWLVSAVIVVGITFVRAQYVRSMFVAPGVALVFTTIFLAGKKPKFVCDFFLFFGNHSTNIWLTHMFFYHTLFVNFVFVAKYPLFIFLFMMMICVALSYALDFLYKPIMKKILLLNLPREERKEKNVVKL